METKRKEKKRCELLEFGIVRSKRTEIEKQEKKSRTLSDKILRVRMHINVIRYFGAARTPLRPPIAAALVWAAPCVCLFAGKLLTLTLNRRRERSEKMKIRIENENSSHVLRIHGRATVRCLVSPFFGMESIYSMCSEKNIDARRMNAFTPIREYDAYFL